MWSCFFLFVAKEPTSVDNMDISRKAVRADDSRGTTGTEAQLLRPSIVKRGAGGANKKKPKGVYAIFRVTENICNLYEVQSVLRTDVSDSNLS